MSELKDDIAFLAQWRISAGGHRDHVTESQVPAEVNGLNHLAGLSAVGVRKEHIASCNCSNIAMWRIAGMKINRRGAGGRKGGSGFLRHVTSFSDTGGKHLTSTSMEHLHRLLDGGSDWDSDDGVGFGTENVLDTDSTYTLIKGVNNIDKCILVDQEPIGRTPRSNPVTYIGVFNYIRDLS